MSTINLSTDNSKNINRTYLEALPSKSSKVRYLHSLGCSRTEISNILFIRYQFVRNVLMTKLKGE